MLPWKSEEFICLLNYTSKPVVQLHTVTSFIDLDSSVRSANVDISMKIPSRSSTVVTKAKKIILCRKHGADNSAESSTMPLYNLTKCPHLEYCVRVRLYHLKNKAKWNGVQWNKVGRRGGRGRARQRKWSAAWEDLPKKQEKREEVISFWARAKQNYDWDRESQARKRRRGRTGEEKLVGELRQTCEEQENAERETSIFVLQTIESVS